MTFDEYQKLAMRTVNRAPGEELPIAQHLAVMALGLTGEAGETADLIKKHIGHGHELSHAALIKECGDTLWYLTALCEAVGHTLEEVAEQNIAKLRIRYPDGFSHEASRNRSA